MPSADKADQPPRLRVNKLTIENYKGIDCLELDFPHPVLPDEPDITVIGSENGAGKTSVLEAVLLTTSYMVTPASHTKRLYQYDRPAYSALQDRLIRADSDMMRLSADLTFADQSGPASLELKPGGLPGRSIPGRLEEAIRRQRPQGGELPWDHDAEILRHVLSPPFDPYVDPLILYFHSYRRVQEGQSAVRIDASREGDDVREPERTGLNLPEGAFKEAIARAAMVVSGVLDDLPSQKAEKQLEELTDLTQEFARVRPTRRMKSEGKALEPMVKHIDTTREFRLDGLSSGQKELVSLLFLVWLHSQDGPRIVLIDEPELHLNAQWHRRLVRWLGDLAPHNQYILATHSEEIFGAVDKRHRILLATQEARSHA